MTAPVVVFAVGNPSRGDDALGPLIAEHMAEEVQAGGLAGVEVIEDFQLQVEHALDLEGRSLALFIDAGTGTPAPYRFARIGPEPGYGHTTHALEPPAVLQVFRQTQGQEPPPAFVLCVKGESFELGEALSPAALRHMEAAQQLLHRLFREPTAEAWSALSEGNQR